MSAAGMTYMQARLAIAAERLVAALNAMPFKDAEAVKALAFYRSTLMLADLNARRLYADAASRHRPLHEG